jgi:chemotaxis protein CheY-P-specific phosphatase CheC
MDQILIKGAFRMLNIAIEQNETSIQEEIFLPPQEIKKLYEAAQKGAAESINSLRDFLGPTNDIHLNCLSFLPLSVMVDRIKIFYPNHLGYHLRFSGEISGEIYTFFRETDALFLVEKITGQKRLKNLKNINRVEISVLAELVNILANAFWRTLTEKTAFNWWFTPPTRVNELSKALSYSAKIYTLDNLLIHFEYLIPNLEIRIQSLMLPTQHTIQKLLTKLNTSPVILES